MIRNHADGVLIRSNGADGTCRERDWNSHRAGAVRGAHLRRYWKTSLGAIGVAAATAAVAELGFGPAKTLTSPPTPASVAPGHPITQEVGDRASGYPGPDRRVPAGPAKRPRPGRAGPGPLCRLR